MSVDRNCNEQPQTSKSLQKDHHHNLSINFNANSDSEVETVDSPKRTSSGQNTPIAVDMTTQNDSNDSIHLFAVEAPSCSSGKQNVAKKTKPRKRKLRPEDERTLEILAEKFRKDQTGMVCQVNSCRSKPLLSTKPSNLKRHLSQRHPKEYANLFPNEVSRKTDIELEVYNSVQDAIELVTVNGYPFAMLNASGMRGFIKSRLQPLYLVGRGLPINRLDIVKEVAVTSDSIKNQIKSELKGKMISVMFDMCTISTLATLGVNVTFMKDANVICRTLGIIEIKKRHTAVNLADMLYDLLTEYDVPLKNVFSITCDTAKNASNTSEILNLVANCAETDDEIADQSIFDIGPDDEELDFGMDIENEVELQKIIANAAENSQLVQDIAKDFVDRNAFIALINQINCGTHTFQLAVNGGLVVSNAMNVISLVHDMCILMRTQLVTIELRKLDAHIILPPLDTEVRWNSKYIMVNI